MARAAFSYTGGSLAQLSDLGRAGELPPAGPIRNGDDPSFPGRVVRVESILVRREPFPLPPVDC